MLKTVVPTFLFPSSFHELLKYFNFNTDGSLIRSYSFTHKVCNTDLPLGIAQPMFLLLCLP